MTYCGRCPRCSRRRTRSTGWTGHRRRPRTHRNTCSCNVEETTAWSGRQDAQSIAPSWDTGWANRRHFGPPLAPLFVQVNSNAALQPVMVISYTFRQLYRCIR